MVRFDGTLNRFRMVPMTRSLKCQLFTLSLLSLAVHDAHAACTFSPTAGDDSFVCDSGTAPSLIDLSGNNALVLPVNGLS